MSAAREVVVEASADVDTTATIGAGTRVWHLAQVREGAVVGRDCVIGRGAYVDAGVRVGNACKVQNHALIYAPAVVADGVFVGPAAVLTNDRTPRAVSPDGAPVRAGDWSARGVVLRGGASVGARAVVLGGVEVGEWAMIGAGAVVTKDVPAHALVVGVPARRVGWVGRDGREMVERPDGTLVDAATGTEWVERDGQLQQVG